MKVKVINSNDSKWYKCGEIYEVSDKYKYEGIGIQVWNASANIVRPDVIMDGDYEYVD